MSNKYAEPSTPLKNADGPIISGGSVIAIKYDKGILMGADTMMRYAGCYWYKDIQRMHQISDNIVLGSAGDYADLQKTLKMIEEKHELDEIAEDQFEFLGPKDYCKWLANLQFNKRMRVDPLYNSHIVAGLDKKSGETYLGTVDLYGNNYEAPFV